ncbi:holin [Streptomyces wuyuanensis]|uniref:holin n=1 Tax=Streptomyces wuyuanensis TaxID=1196353 RepID=UPI00341E8B90
MDPSPLWTVNFWQSTAERAAKTFAQALAAVLTNDGLGWLDISWPVAVGSAGTAAFLSLLTSIASAPSVEPGTPSLVRTRPVHESSLPAEDSDGDENTT